MTRRLMILFGLLACVATFIGCGPAWQVVKQAVPNPILGKTTFAVLPVDFTNLRVGEKSEADWQADKDADSKKSWQDDKVAMNEKFAAELVGEAGGEGITVTPGTAAGNAAFVVKPVATFVEPGIYTGFVNIPSEFEITLQITTPDGAVVDEIRIKTAEEASLYNPASGSRLRDCAENAGVITGKYLRSRVKGE